MSRLLHILLLLWFVIINSQAASMDNPNVYTLNTIKNIDIIELNGKWQYEWGIISNYQKMKLIKEKLYVEIPSLWTKSNVYQNKYKWSEVATFYCEVILPKKNIGDRFGIKFYGVSTNYKVFINNALRLNHYEESSLVGNDYLENACYFSADSDVINLTVQVSNYVKPNFPGIVKSVKFGTEKDIKHLDLLDKITSIFLLSFYFFTLLIYLISLFVAKWNKEIIYLLILSILFVLKTATAGERIAMRLFEFISFQGEYKLWLSAMLILPIFYLIVDSAFSIKSSSKYKIPDILSLLIIIMYLFILIIPFKVIDNYINYIPYMEFTLLISMFFILFRKSSLEQLDLYYALGFLAMLICIVFDFFIVFFKLNLNLTLIYGGVIFNFAYIISKSGDIRDQIQNNHLKDLKVHNLMNLFNNALLSTYLLKLKGVDDINISRIELNIKEAVKVLENGYSTNDNPENEVINTHRIKSIIDNIIARLKIDADYKQIKFVVNIEEGFLFYCDSDELNTILKNIIVNSIRFSYSESQVVISAYRYRNKAVIEISDSGYGMPKRVINSLLSNISIFSNPTPDNESDTGKGLSLSNRLIIKNKGVLRISSKVNEGTTVKLEFRIKV